MAPCTVPFTIFSIEAPKPVPDTFVVSVSSWTFFSAAGDSPS
jgi:hypothetical protein